MVDIPRSSFIPKEADGMTPGRVRRRRTFHVFGFLATALLIGSLITAGAVYFLKNTAQTNLEKSKQTLNEQKSLFNPESIAEVREFDRRLQAASLLIKNHISPLRVFDAVEKVTKQKVQFTNFELTHTPALEVMVSLQGTTPEFRTLALQEASLAEDSILKNVAFSEVSATDDNKGVTGGGRSVNFSLEGIINPSLIQYNGQTLTSSPQKSFVQSGNDIVAVEGGALDTNTEAVLGESITNNPL